MALPLLIAAPSCSPVQQYREAARSLRFTLDRVEPNLELAFPLDRSRITFNVTIGVVNPSDVPFHLLGFEGTFRMETDGGLRPLGEVRMPQSLELPAQGKAPLFLALSFGYRDLSDRWPAIQAALRGERPGVWQLDGVLRGEAYGIPVQLPVQVRRSFGTAP